MDTLVLVLTSLVTSLHAQHYNHTKALFKQLFDTERYNPQVRPILDQSERTRVEVFFSLVSIESVDDTRQRFVCNGFLSLYWDDEILVWDPFVAGGVTLIHPLPKQVWRPRIVLLNTLGERDLFADDISPMVVFANGTTSWNPGSLFTASCSLNLLKYPFDEQKCQIQMLSMGLPDFELEFLPMQVYKDFYSVNGEWDLVATNITTSLRVIDDVELPSFEIHFHIKRRSTFYILNIILPFVCLSFLNMLIFTIPQESGEKISYGITVLLALSVFLSIIGEMLPKSSDTVPHVIVYLFILFLLSALSVIDSIFIVFLHHMEEREEHHQRVLKKLRRMVGAIKKMKKGVAGFATNPKALRKTSPLPGDLRHIQQPAEVDYLEIIELDGGGQKERGGHNVKDKGHSQKDNGQKGEECMTYKKTAAAMDMVSFFIFVFSWISVTMWFFLSTAS